MLKNAQQINRTWTGALAGAALGILIALFKNNFARFPGLAPLADVNPFTAFLMTTLAGAIGGALLGLTAAPGLTRNSDNKEYKLQLKEERLDIKKERVKEADVSIHKETVTEEKTMTVPLTREELVVEKKATGHDLKTTRIPLTQEEIEIEKRNRKLNDVDVYKNHYTTTQTVEADLLKEELHLDTEGEAKITEE